MKLATVQNIRTNGMSFNVRVVEKGEQYGLNMCLTHEKDMPMIEFYDTRYKFDKIGDIIMGQFITRYSLDTFKTVQGTGLNLEGGVADWSLDSDAVAQTHALLEMWNL